MLFFFPARPPVEKSIPSEAESRPPPKGGWTGLCMSVEQRFHLPGAKRNAHVRRERGVCTRDFCRYKQFFFDRKTVNIVKKQKILTSSENEQGYRRLNKVNQGSTK